MTTHPRRWTFSLRTLFVLVTLAAGMAWWVQWATATVTRFVNLMATVPDKAQEMSDYSGIWDALRKPHGRPYFEPHPRMLADVAMGRQVFTVVVPMNSKSRSGNFEELTGTLYFVRGKLTGPEELDARETTVPPTLMPMPE